MGIAAKQAEAERIATAEQAEAERRKDTSAATPDQCNQSSKSPDLNKRGDRQFKDLKKADNGPEVLQNGGNPQPEDLPKAAGDRQPGRKSGAIPLTLSEKNTSEDNT